VRGASGGILFQVFPDPYIPPCILSHAGKEKVREGVGDEQAKIVGQSEQQALANIRNGLHAGNRKGLTRAPFQPLKSFHIPDLTEMS
jgi:hypothetical protein